MIDYVLKNGTAIPQIGIGTWQINDRNVMADVVKNSKMLGYRMIDTAAAYGNEIAVAKAIQESGYDRTEFYISDKVWNSSRGSEEVINACFRSMKKLKTDYIDLYLIHWPASMRLYPNWAEINAYTWKGMEELYKTGKVKAIGVCNFKIHHLEELKKTAEIMPMVNQVEFHPGMNQNDLLDYCKTNDILIEASSPLGNGQIINNEILRNVATRNNKTVAQVCLRWGIQKGLIVIPKTSNLQRLKENIDLFDFELDIDDMATIDSIPFCGGIGIDSDEVTEFG